mgnify:CR=1 FL=1
MESVMKKTRWTVNSWYKAFVNAFDMFSLVFRGVFLVFLTLRETVWDRCYGH